MSRSLRSELTIRAGRRDNHSELRPNVDYESFIKQIRLAFSVTLVLQSLAYECRKRSPGVS
jgi:hypothetical protein